MRLSLPQFLKTPRFADEDQTRAAGVLHVILLTLFVVLGGLAAITTHPLTVYITAGMSLSYLGLWLLMRRGHVKPASRLLMGSLIAGITLIVYFNGSIRVPAASGYLACIVVAGLTLSKRSTIAWTFIINALLFVLYQLEVRGLLPPVFYTETSFLQWATYAGTVTITGVMLLLAHTSILNALALARLNAYSLEERNQDLGAEIAERRQAEQALRLSEARYRTLVGASPDGILQADTDGVILFASPQLLSMLQVKEASEVVGQPISSLVAPEDRERACKSIHSSVQGSLQSYNTYTFLRSDGTRFAVETSSAPWQNAQDQTGGMISIVRDITERQKAERALRESEERYRTLFELESDAILLVDYDTFKIEDANPAAVRLYGYSYSELLSMSAMKLSMEPEYADPSDSQVVHIPLQYHHNKDGAVFPVEITWHYFDWQNTRMLLIVSRDISDRVQTEEALKKRLQALTQPLDAPLTIEFSDLFDIARIQAVQDSFAEAVGVASIVTDLGGTPITRPSNFSRLCAQLVQKPQHGLSDCYCANSGPPETIQDGPAIQICPNSGLWRASAGITVGGKHIANWLIGQVKSKVVADSSLLQYSTEVGANTDSVRQALAEIPGMSKEQFHKIAHALYLLANELSQEAYQNMQQARFITERKQMEEKLREHREHLEELVQQRTTQLTAINQELEAFSYSVAHDLRSPLRAIDGFSRTLLEEHAGQLNPRGLAYLERIMAADQRMGQLIDDLLSLSRLNRSEMISEFVNMSTIALDILADLHQRHPEREVEVSVADGLVVKADRRLISILLENLLGNAWKFTAKTKRAHIEFGIEPGKSPTFFVRDNGAGFDMAYADKLFGAFQRLHTEGEFPGTGIGLATVKRIIHRHNGEVWAAGEVNLGATFYFTLPEEES